MKRIVLLASVVFVLVLLVSSVNADEVITTTITCSKTVGIAANMNIFADTEYVRAPNDYWRFGTIRASGAYFSGLTLGNEATGSGASAWKTNQNRTINIDGYINFNSGIWTPFGLIVVSSGRETHSCSRSI
jgi:hypothetical protein